MDKSVQIETMETKPTFTRYKFDPMLLGSKYVRWVPITQDIINVNSYIIIGIE